MTSPKDAQRVGRIVVGLFPNRSGAEASIRELKGAGFTNEQIGVATQDQNQRDDNGAEPADPATGMAEGAAVGAATGGVVGGLVGLIGSLLIPGLGPVIVGGVLASTLMGMGLGVATGGLIGALVGMGVPEEDAKYFDAGIHQGGTLVTVDAGAATPQAVAILQHHGADLGPTVKARNAGEERRYHQDESYTGPERRLVAI